MAGVVGVRFKQACRVYYFDPADLELLSGDWVVVESARGQELARVVIAPGQVISSGMRETLKPVLRKAAQEDIELASDVQQKDKEALRKAAEIVTEMNLPMKVISAECNIDANHVTVFFRAEERVDFRDLVKRLSNAMKMRVDLRQAGPRDAAKMVGGMGRCGRTLCCATFLTELTPVSIKMAKEQDLPLNPTKISGVCGRLLCCLSYEVSDYRSLRAEKRAAAAAAPTGLAAEGKEPVGDHAVEGGEKAVQAAEPEAETGEKTTGQQEPHRKRRRPRRRKRPMAAGTGESAPAGSQPAQSAPPGPSTPQGAAQQ